MHTRAMVLPTDSRIDLTVPRLQAHVPEYEDDIDEVMISSEEIEDCIRRLGDEISAGMYVSNQQSPTYGINLIVRAGMPPQSLQRAVRSAVDRVNRNQALSDVRTLEQIPVVLGVAALTFLGGLLLYAGPWARPSEGVRLSLGDAARLATYPALSVLVVACPCALISPPPVIYERASGRPSASGSLPVAMLMMSMIDQIPQPPRVISLMTPSFV